MDYYYICPVCGLYGLYTKPMTACEFCGSTNLISIPKETINETKNYIFSLPPEKLEKYILFEDCDDPKNRKQVVALREYRRSKYVYNSPLFDKQKYEERVAWQKSRNLESERKRQRAAKQISCPYCGSTEFQMVPRKWSLFTGLLTNKVDRVCVKCKKRF